MVCVSRVRRGIAVATKCCSAMSVDVCVCVPGTFQYVLYAHTRIHTTDIESRSRTRAPAHWTLTIIIENNIQHFRMLEIGNVEHGKRRIRCAESVAKSTYFVYSRCRWIHYAHQPLTSYSSSVCVCSCCWKVKLHACLV